VAVIEIEHFTKDYGKGRGVFDVSIAIEKGECYGYLGPNGAGKTTTIRHLMGFSRPQNGTLRIEGRDCWEESSFLKSRIGYLPGELAFPKGMTGTGFLKMMQKMRHLTDTSYTEKLIRRFELDAEGPIRGMSLGVQRKLAVVNAFMHDPDILILDEPTSGLDPVMQDVFIDYICEEKERGKTILLSSHIFHEVDATCDRIAIIKDGKIVSEFIADELKNSPDRIYEITFEDSESFEKFLAYDYRQIYISPEKNRVRFALHDSQINQFVSQAASLHTKNLEEIPFSLEDYFMNYYKEEKTFEGVPQR